MCDTISVSVTDLGEYVGGEEISTITGEDGKPRCLCCASDDQRCALAVEAVKRLWPLMMARSDDRQIIVECR